MRLIESLGRWGMATLVLLLAATPALAQNTGSLRGLITDTSGAVLPGVTVVLSSEDTKAARQSVTDAKGSYYFAALLPGSYTLSAELAGFKKRTANGVRVSPNDTKGLDFSMDVGAQTEEVTVTAEKELIQTETGAREGLITSAQIENLSIISRSPLELLRILPGTVAPDINSLETTGAASDPSRYNVNGIRGSNNVFTLDGSRMMDIGCNCGLIVAPNTDFVSEVKVQSSNYAAEFGSGGIQVSAITKGGSSEFHGTVYDYLRSHKVAANDRSNAIAGVAKPKSKFQYPGANISGPILIPGTGFNKNRDKAFFFLGGEFTYQKVDSGSHFAVVPTVDQRNGIFGNYGGGQNLNQGTNPVLIPSGFPGAGSPAPGNNLSPYIDPMGQVLINLYPQPNGSFQDNRYNYVVSALQPQNSKQFTLRLDYNFSDSTKAYVRLARDRGESQQARGFWWQASDYELPSPAIQTSIGRSGSLNLTSVLSPTTTNELLFTYSRLTLDNSHLNQEKMELANYGLSGYLGFFGAQSPFVPAINSWGNNLGSLWEAADQNNVFAYNSTLQVSDTFTKVLNAHALKVGFTVEKLNKNQNFQNEANTRIVLGQGWIPGSTNNDYGDLLVGRPAQVISGTALDPGNWVAYNFDGFLQDSWKIKKNLTIEYGVRLSKWTNNSETGGRGAVFNPATYNPSAGTFLDAQKTQLNGVQYVSLGQVDKALIDNRPLFILPRVNFAYDPSGNGNLVIRGGAGTFYNRPMGNAEYDILRIPPNGYQTTVDAYQGSGLGPVGLTYNTVKNVDPLNQIGRLGLTSINPDSVDYPRSVTASLSVAKRIPFQQVLEVAYVGTFGRHLLDTRQSNVIEPGTLLSGTVGNSDLSVPVNRLALSADVVNTLRPYPALTNVTYWEYNGTSNYHSLQATLSRQTGRRLQYFLTYTFGKGLGTNVSNGEYGQIDPFESRVRSYGVLAYDRTHIVNASYNYSFPDATKKGGVLGAIVNGWQLSGITTWASGIPISLQFSGDLNSAGAEQAWWGTPDHQGYSAQTGLGTGSTMTPILTCDPRLGGSGLGDKILDINCLQIPGLGQSGSFTPGVYMRTPSRINVDLSLFKNFALGKDSSRKLQFRVGAFNLFNQAVPGVNGQDLDLTLQTECNVRVNGVPNGAGGFVDNQCDPAQGYHYSENTIKNFGKIIQQRGHRVIEFALKLYF